MLEFKQPDLGDNPYVGILQAESGTLLIPCYELYHDENGSILFMDQVGNLLAQFPAHTSYLFLSSSLLEEEEEEEADDSAASHPSYL